MSHTCKALVITCIDFRFHAKINEFLQQQGLVGDYDLVSLAGSQKNFLDAATEAIAMRQVELSKKLHDSQEVYVIAHWDCGAYGGSKAFTSDDEQKAKYSADLAATREKINAQFAELVVKTYLAMHDGEQATDIIEV